MTSGPTDPRDAYAVLDLALSAGEVLLSSGAGASDVTATCLAVAAACGLRGVQCDITFTSISLSWQPHLDVAPVTGMRLVRQRALDYTRVTAAHNLVEDLAEHRISRSEAERQLRLIVAARHPYRRPVVTAARAMLAASVAVLLGAGPLVVGAAFGATVVVDLVNTWLGRGALPVFYQNVVGGLIATAVALCLVAADGDVRPGLVVAGGIVLLLPGVTLIGAVQDAITGLYVTAAARAFETFLLTAGIISGVAIALSVGVRLGLPIRIDDHPSTALLDLPAQLLAAGAVAASFAVANYAPRRTVPAAAAAGIVGWATFVLVDQLQLPPTLASAAAAVMIGLGSRAFARRQRVPALVYVVAGIMPLLPGLLIYRGMRGLAEGDTFGGMTLLGQAVSVGLAIAAGALLGDFLGQLTGRSAATDRPGPGRRLVGPRHWRRRPEHRGARRQATREDGAPRPTAPA